MNTEQVREGVIEFYVNKKLHRFKVINNLPDNFGISLECAVNNWVVRTDEYSAESFCEYVNGKMPEYICVKPTPENIKKYNQ